MSSCCLLLVFGIPAAGKSSLVKELLSRTDVWPWDGPTQCVHVCFDDFYPTDNRGLSSYTSSDDDLELPFNWKQQRSIINNNIEKYLTINTKGNSSSCSTCDEDNIEDKWEDFKQKMCSRNNNGNRTRILKDGRFSCDRTVIIIDDNLPLRSMRHEYYQMARKFSCGFCEVMLTCELPTALQWNQDRPRPIPSNTITAMASLLEAPQPEKYHWEGKSLVMETDTWWDWDQWSEICSRIYELCQRSMHDPVTPCPVEDPLVKEECRLVTMNNLAHQVDQKLRECVSSVCKESKSSANNVAQIAKLCNGLRKQILEEFRLNKFPGSQQANVTDTLTTVEQRFYLLYSNKKSHQ